MFSALSQDRLSDERKARLDALGFDWTPHETDWEAGFGMLKSYYQREGHCDVPQQYTRKTGTPLGNWVSVQRLKKDKLSPERRHRLEELGFIWDAREAAWEEGFHHLKLYKEREGHCNVPARHKEKTALPWVSG